jgi:hypothetical protein
VNRRLTLDYGVRFYWMQPQYDNSGQAANFLPGSYDSARAPRLYRPDIVGGVRVAEDPVTGQTLPAVYIGRIVPGSGTLENGLFQAGLGIEETLYKNRGVHVGPRIGFTYDLTGKAAFVLRSGVMCSSTAVRQHGLRPGHNPPTTLE